MKKHLKYIDGTSDKFWQIEVFGTDYKVTYGKNGTSGTIQTKSFATPEECLKMSEKILAEKIKKGYSETGEVVINDSSKAKSSANTKSSNTAAILEEYDSIIKSSNIYLLLPFLKEKSKGNIDTLKKHILKNKRYWMTYMDLSKDPEYVKKGKHNYQWGTRGNEQQNKIIIASAIALFNKTEINSWNEVINLLNEIKEEDPIMEILLWAKPDWLGTFILDKIKRQEWVNFNYHILRRFEELGLLQYNTELYAICLADTNEWRSKIKTKDFIEMTLSDKIIYERDIPELFNYETDLHENYFENDPVWQTIYKSLLEEKKMSRAFFIENAVQIQTKEWNNNLKLFFRKRLEELNITADDLINYQENIFSFLHNAYPPITTYGIELIKKIHEHPQFNSKSFLEWLEPLMMRSDCKTAIKTVLPVLEKVNKSNPKLNKTIVSVIADVFVISDLALQEKASKIISKIATPKHTELKEKLTSYSSLMQGNIKSLLSSFLDEEALAVATDFEKYTFAPAITKKVLNEEIQLPNEWNDIVFQFGNFINSDEPLHAEILMNIYATSRNLFPSDYAVQLQPYLKQLEKKYFESVHKEYLKSFLVAKIVDIESNYVSRKNNYSQLYTSRTIKFLLDKVQEKINSGSVLPLLSLPSHKPYWVAPKILLERIIQYQKNNEETDLTDLAIAIARMPRENTEEAIPLLDNIEGEMKQLLSFCLGVNERLTLPSGSVFSKLITTLGKPTKETEKLALWAVAARTFYPNDTFTEFENTYLKEIPFVVSPFKPIFKFKEQWNEWTNYQTKKKERSPSWYELRFDMPTYTSIPNYLLYSLDIYKRSNSWEYALHSAGSTLYWNSLMPQNNDPLALVLLQNCHIPDGAKPELKGFLEIINRPEFQFSENTLFLFALCFFLEKKEIRLFASEVLISAIEKQAVDIEKLAQKMAYLTVEKYGAFSRLTDSLIAVKDVSPLHNSALLQLFDSFFENLEIKDKLPTNFKKLIENYVDVLTKTNQKPSEKAAIFFEQWKDNASLKSLIKQILK